MPEVDGSELLDAIEGAVPAIIFVTHTTICVGSFDARRGLLLKPLTKAAFISAHRAKEKIGQGW